MLLNRQTRITVDTPRARAFVGRLRRALSLRGHDFNVCLVDDRQMRRLNAAYRGRPHSTDVLSFPWSDRRRGGGPSGRELRGFLGDIVISAEAARRNARREGQSTANELRWLMLHGVLHLLGYDHDTDQGEMTARELALREQLRIAGVPSPKKKRRGRKRTK
ncbi:MAG: rRNA maturation RNase YbeY [Acidobacteriia bacterium]|nr:rRNA maturation RNase YbeY [Terriglobia bacterium]